MRFPCAPWIGTSFPSIPAEIIGLRSEGVLGGEGGVAQVAIRTCPYRGTARRPADLRRLEPSIKLAGVAANIRLGRPRHLWIAARGQRDRSIAKTHGLMSFPLH